MITININAKRLEDGLRIWRVAPGDGYRFLDSFLRQGVVFLEMPGLTLPSVPFDSPEASIRERIHVSASIGKWVELQRRFLRTSQTEKPPALPERSLQAFKGRALSKNQTNMFGSVRNIFEHAKKNDLVVVAGRIPDRVIHVGRLLDAPGKFIDVTTPYFLEETTPARRVSWFSPIDERRIPPELSGGLRLPIGANEIARPFYNVVLENSYGTFYKEDLYTSRIDIKSIDFNTDNNYDFSSIARLSSIICSAVDAGVTERRLHSLIDKIAITTVDERYRSVITLNVNSPGKGNLIAATVVPIFFSAMMALLVHADGQAKPQPHDVQVVNTPEGVGDPCAAKIEESVRQALRAMGYDQWKAACEMAKRLHTDGGVSTDAKIRGN